MSVIIGTSGADTLQGTGGTDTIDAGAGNDLVFIGAASTIGDSILGGEGDDRFLWRQGEGFDLTFIEGGSGEDTLDFTGHESGYYFRNRSLTLRDGAEPNTIEGWVTGSNGLFSPGLNQPFMNASGIERIVASDVAIELDGFTRALDVVSLGGGAVTTGSGDDLISLASRIRANWDGGETRTLYSSRIDGGGGDDRLNLQKASDEYLFVKTDAGWSIYDGGKTVHQVTNIELVSFAGGASAGIGYATGIDFDAAGYLARYADLRSAFGADSVKAFQHFQDFGKVEGRLGFFDGLSYIASHRDLIGVLGSNASAGIQHYELFGETEGRATTFNPKDYAASHLDLARIIGSDTARAAAHYISYGVFEGRPTVGFDAVAYQLSNADLAGMTPVQARDHWLAFGADEGRLGDAAFGRDQSDHNGFGGTTNFNVTLSLASDFASGADKDWFSITLATGFNYRIDGSSNVGGLAIFDSVGRLIASDSDGQDFIFKAREAGGGTSPVPFYLVVTAAGEAGSYTVDRTLIYPPATQDADASLAAVLQTRAVTAIENDEYSTLEMLIDDTAPLSLSEPVSFDSDWL